MRAAARRLASTALPSVILAASAASTCTLDPRGTGERGRAGAARRREADVLYANNAEWLIWKGWSEAVIELAPNYASGEQLAEHDLLDIDPEDRVSSRASGGALVMTATGARGAATVATDGLSWERVGRRPRGPAVV
ncbi:hypothetical protein [Sorangium sp. So ce854]|uniref:hypothetical protein n=1 Tax=Sorangium sp. So ce854 TaxID=3133322 RepID=UPI003F604687